MPPHLSSDDESDFSDAYEQPVPKKVVPEKTPSRKAKKGASAPEPVTITESEEEEEDEDEDVEVEDAPRDKGKQKSGGNGDDNDEEQESNDEEEGDGDDDEEEEYVVDKIIRHGPSDGGVMLYEIKWKGYSSNDNTWEPEESLEGATEVLEAYFKKIGGRPVDEGNPKDKEKKKRGRKSASSTSTPGGPSKRMKTEVPVRNGHQRSGRSKDLEADEKLDWPTSQSDWKPPKVAKDSWEESILSVEAIDRDRSAKGSKQLWAFVRWVDLDDEGTPRMSRVLLESLHKAAPQAAIKFYEQHLYAPATSPTV